MLRKLIGFGAALAGVLASGAALALPYDWETGFQPAASPVMERLEDFHHFVLVIVTAVTLLVAALLVWVIIRYNHRANPVPSKVAHNTLLEVAWTLIPVIILVIIAIPSFKLLYYEADIPPPYLTITAIGHQWYWSYVYPQNGNLRYDSVVLSDAADKKAHEPRLLGVDNPVVVPVNKVVEVDTTGADVIHSWAVPQFGVKMDAIPGRINKTWFKAIRTGTFYGECSELCGARHAYMPIEVKVVTLAQFNAWVAMAKKKFSSADAPDANTRLASR
jgi:cytochrome c oxidase subunit II